MVTKRTEFKGSTIQDKLAPISNFICNDTENLKYTPPSGTPAVTAEANNRFIISEYIAPVWSKITVNYNKIATYGDHDGLIQIYGIDNLGSETLIYEHDHNLTETGVQNFAQIDMLKSACTSAVHSLDDETEEMNFISLDMPKLRTSYDDVSLKASWYQDTTNYPYRKGIAVNIPFNRIHAHMEWTADYGKDQAAMTPKSLLDDYWYASIYVAYNAHMQADFGDLLFTGFDGVTKIDHWIYNKSDSNYAYVMLRIPWYFGYLNVDTIKTHSTYHEYYGQGDHKGSKKWTNPDVQFLWMYYGNATASNSTTPVSGASGYHHFDDFTTDTSTTWTTVNTSATATMTWDASSSLDFQINANNTSAGFGAYKALPSTCFDAKGNPGYDIIWKLENIPTTAGNYDAAVFISDAWVSGATMPANALGLWISASDVYAVKVEAGVSTAYTAGTLSFNHDDVEPLYVRARLHKTHQSGGHGAIKWEISKDCKNWHHVVTLIYRTDFNIDPATLGYHGIRMSSWAAAPAFNMELDIDWIMITESHELPKRRYHNEHFEFSDSHYNDVSSGTDASATIAITTATSTLDFAITGGSQIWDASGTCPIFGNSQYAIENGLVYECKIVEATRTGSDLIRAGASIHLDANKHLDLDYQLYKDAAFNKEMRGQVVYGGVVYFKHEEGYERQSTVSTSDPLYIRFIPISRLNHILVQYSRDGWNWITAYVDAINSSFPDVTNMSLHLANNGSGNGTMKVDYFTCTYAAYIADLGGNLAFTAEQAWTDYSDIQPLSETSWTNWYSDNFEDNKVTARTSPYRDYTYSSATNTFATIANTLGAEKLADNQGQFETGVSLTAGNATITQSSTQAKSGTYSAKLVATAQDSYGAPGGDYADGTFRVGLAADKYYYLNAWVYPTSTNHIGDGSYYRAGRVCVFYKDSGGTIREIQSEGPVTLNAWNEIKFRFYIPSGATAAAIRYYNGVNGQTIYWDNISLKEGNKPVTGTYSVRSVNTSKTDTAISVSTMEQPHTGYTATFKFAPEYDGVGDQKSLYHRLWLLRASDLYSYTCLDIIPSGATVAVRVTNYDVASGNALTTATFRSASSLLPQKEYTCTVIDSGSNVTLYIDGVKYINNYSYYAGNYVSKVYPGVYNGFGSNYANRGIWDDIVVKPGYWYNGIQYTDPSLATVVTGTYPASRTWQLPYDNMSRYRFKMPSTYIRNQPMIVQWKDQGATSFQYSKRFNPRMGGVYKVGPNGLDKYIGMRTRILFNGDSSDSFQVDNIIYEYEV